MGKGKVVFTRGYSCIVLYVEDLKEKDEWIHELIN